MDCPMNARTHADPDIHVVIERWKARPKKIAPNFRVNDPIEPELDRLVAEARRQMMEYFFTHGHVPELIVNGKD